MKFGNSVADIFIIKHTQFWLGVGRVRTCHFYRTLSRVTVFRGHSVGVDGLAGPVPVRPSRLSELTPEQYVLFLFLQ